MKKMKGVVLSESSYGGGVVYEDAKIRMRHQNLMQDYLQLHRETEAKRNKLQSTKQKKLTLMAEVRFLKRKVEQLKQNHTKKSRLEQPSLQAHQYPPPRPGIQSKNAKTKRSYVRKDAALRPHVKIDDYNHRQRLYGGEESSSSLSKPTPNFELNQIQRNPNWYVASVRNPDHNFHLNQKGRFYNGTEAGLRHPSPVLDSSQMTAKVNDAVKRNPIPAFDLNQVLGEEEENQAYTLPTRVEVSQKVLINGITDDQQNDMNLLACRNLGNGAKRGGKRKISWQDQVEVALRV